jgi:hypothetical protein
MIAIGIPIHQGAYYHLEALVDSLSRLSLPKSTTLLLDVNNSDELFYEEVCMLTSNRLRHLSPWVHFEPKGEEDIKQESAMHVVFRSGSGHGKIVEGGGVKAHRITRARERIRSMAVQLGVEYIYWCDSDMLPPPDTVSRLLETGKYYVAARCHIRKSDPPTVSAWSYVNPNIYKDGGRVTISSRIPNKLPKGQRIVGGALPLSNLMGSIVYWSGGNDDSLAEVDGVGLAATLVHSNVFMRIDFDVEHKLADDAQFAFKARAEGFGVWLHPGVFVPHIDQDGSSY